MPDQAERVAHTSAERQSPAAVFDAMGHCTSCGINEKALQRITDLIAQGKVASVYAHHGCGHVVVYRGVSAT